MTVCVECWKAGIQRAAAPHNPDSIRTLCVEHMPKRRHLRLVKGTA